MYSDFQQYIRNNISNCDSYLCYIFQTTLTIIIIAIAVIFIIIFAEIVTFSWLGWLNISLFMRNCSSESGEWEPLLFWLKQYENKNDLIIRLCCINYHLGSKYKSVENLMNKCNDYKDITFKDIRKHSKLKSDQFMGLLHTYAVGMNFEWKRNTPHYYKCCPLTLYRFTFLYLCSKIVLAWIPIIGLFEKYNDFTLINILQIIYFILFMFTIGLSFGVFRHLYIFIHIMPGTFHLTFPKYHVSLPLHLLNKYYLNVTNNIKCGKQKKMNVLQDYFVTDILDIIVEYLSVNPFEDEKN
eukprot:366010_1